MNEPSDRRPLASRDTGWARALTRWLAATSVSPNQISIASMVAAAVAGGALWSVGSVEGAARASLLLLAASACQIRLVCNLMDGLVAIEAGRRAPDGAFWNEFPDRVSDILILVGLGLGLGNSALGWAAATAAVFTAYTRELGHALGLPADYRGPMAKPHRMALITLACLLSLADPFWNGTGWVLWVALWLIALGSGFTVIRRARSMVRTLGAAEPRVYP